MQQMTLSIGRIWHNNKVIEIPPKDDSGAIYGEMSTLAPVMLNAVIPKKNELLVDQLQCGLNR